MSEENPMKKNFYIEEIVYEMLVEISKNKRKTPDKWLEEIVKENYKKM